MKDFSYFTLNFQKFIDENHPELSSDYNFIKERGDSATTVYCNAKLEGKTHIEALELANDFLYKGYHFSKLDVTKNVLELDGIDWSEIDIMPYYEKFLVIFSKYNLIDEFEDTEEYNTLKYELLGAI